ncbi:MAG TPA: MFS transporter [Acetobacteraceae bacterium]|nr:MFS transporter [Acetobacteraceae bacterium]
MTQRPFATNPPVAAQRKAATGTPDSARAWVMTAAAFIVGFVVFGVLYSFGVFLSAIVEDFHASRAAASALFSATGLGFYLAGPATGHLGDRFGPRVMAAAGAVLMGGGLALTACIGQLWVGYLTYGLAVGVGASCAYIPTLALIGGWFVRQRQAALGVAAAGTGVGTLAVPPLAAALIEHYGWRVTDVILGLGCFLLLAGCAAMVRPSPLTGGAEGRKLRQVIGSPSFLMLYACWALGTTALFVPFVYLPAFARELGASQVAASALLSLLGGMGLIGRLGTGTLGNRIGMVRLFRACVLIMGASNLLWLTLPTYGGLILFVVVLGLAYGARIALMPGVLIEFFGLQNLGVILGAFFTGSGIASILGPMLAGVIVDRTGSYHWGIVFALAAGLLAFLTIVPLRHKAAAHRNAAHGQAAR